MKQSKRTLSPSVMQSTASARRVVLLACLAASAVACGVESTNQGSDGVDEDADGGDGDSCPAGVAVVLGDYVSTQVALSDLEGKTQSESFISTGSTTTDGLAFALSGDVAVPAQAPSSGRVVLLDRYGTNVITWVDPEDAEVLGQLPVGTGFESNPQDYLELGDGTAVVSRWGQNAAPGAEDHDAGGDLLFIDTETPEILDSVVLPAPDDLPARPSEMYLSGNEILVTLDRIALDFSQSGDAMIVGVDVKTKEITFEQTLTGRKACSGATLSPDGSTLAVVCTGALGADGEIESITQSALMLFDAKERPLKLTQTFEAADLLNLPLQDTVAFASDSNVLLKTQTALGGAENNLLFSLDLETGETVELVEASPNDMGAGKGLVYGSLMCSPGCSDICLMADADEGVLQRVQLLDDGTFKLLSPVTVEDKVGLSPLGLGHR